MPKALNELKKQENSLEIKNNICQILEKYRGNALKLSELKFKLMRESNLGIELGGKLFLFSILKDLIKQNKIQSIISPFSKITKN